MVVLRSSPNDLEQLLKFSNFYLKPILRNISVKKVNFEILKSRDIVEILSLGINPRLARNVESENESTLKVKMKVGFSLFILLRRSQARVKRM